MPNDSKEGPPRPSDGRPAKNPFASGPPRQEPLPPRIHPRETPRPSLPPADQRGVVFNRYELVSIRSPRSQEELLSLESTFGPVLSEEVLKHFENISNRIHLESRLPSRAKTVEIATLIESQELVTRLQNQVSRLQEILQARSVAQFGGQTNPQTFHLGEYLVLSRNTLDNPHLFPTIDALNPVFTTVKSSISSIEELEKSVQTDSDLWKLIQPRYQEIRSTVLGFLQKMEGVKNPEDALSMPFTIAEMDALQALDQDSKLLKLFSDFAKRFDNIQVEPSPSMQPYEKKTLEILELFLNLEKEVGKIEAETPSVIHAHQAREAFRKFSTQFLDIFNKAPNFMFLQLQVKNNTLAEKNEANRVLDHFFFGESHPNDLNRTLDLKLNQALSELTQNSFWKNRRPPEPSAAKELDSSKENFAQKVLRRLRGNYQGE